MKFPVFTLFILVIVSFLSCNNKVDKDITLLLDKRESAFEEKNPDKYKSLIISSYKVETRDGNKNNEDVLKDFRLNTTPFDSIEMSHKDREVIKEGGKAKVVQKTIVLLCIDDQKTKYEITEVLILEKENNEWKISKESNLDLFRGFVFGKQN
jgi:hypothetical protein